MTTVQLWGSGPSSLRYEALARAKGLNVDRPHFVDGLTQTTPEFLAANPGKQVPALVKPDGTLAGSAAIEEFLLGSDAGAANGWLTTSATLDAVTTALAYPVLGVPAVGDAAKAQTQLTQALNLIEKALVGGSGSLGSEQVDVAVSSALLPAYMTVVGSDALSPYPQAAAWLSKQYSQPAFVQLLGLAPAAPTMPLSAGCDQSPGLVALSNKLGMGWSGNRVRDAFVQFFRAQDHTFWPSSSVVPHNDPTLLFTNAGMNQYKPIFLGQADPNSDFAKLKAACNAQKCIRAGGKHNDLDDVGKDVYHHTFFEMLGNWSFGFYFKEEAIKWAWELLTEVYKLPGERLYATYFGGDESQGLQPDEDARQIWLKYLPASRVLPFGCKDNFWEMGDQGPCGPCTEIHYDRIGGGRDAAALVNEDDPNVLEIWNVVFIQFNRESDGSLKSLPAKHVDTGMGMERVTSVLQGKMSNYATDVFGPIFAAITAVTGADPYTDRVGADDVDNKDMAYRVVADHIRTLSFAIADGARPGSDGREYVLRRVLRRAVRYGREVLGAKEGFFAGLVDSVVANFGGFYPELVKARDTIYEVLRDEESSFSRTLIKGLERFKKAAAAAKQQGSTQLDGKEAFALWDSFGFPVDLTQLMAEEAGMTVDMAGYEAAMEDARNKARAANKKGGGGGLKFEAEATAHLASSGVPLTDDDAKYGTQDVDAKLLAIMGPGGFVQNTEEVSDGPVGLVLDRTSFYAEAGGQVADTGVLEGGPSGTPFAVEDCQVAAGFVMHVGQLPPAPLRVGDAIKARVDYSRRNRIMPNHTFTHVLNYALKAVLGEHVDQKGSIVLPDKLRFDFSNGGALDGPALSQVETMCRKAVGDALSVYTQVVPLQQAKAINGLRAVFGEVYPDPVRVVSVGRPVEELLADPQAEANAGYSIEFCGGTHLKNTSEARAFALITEEGIAKGVRRIVAVTGDEAAAAIKAGEELQARAAAAMKLTGTELEKEVAGLKQAVDAAAIPAVSKSEVRSSLTTLVKLMNEEAKERGAANKAQAAKVALESAGQAAAGGKKFVVVQLEVGLDAKACTLAANSIQQQHTDMAVMVLTADADKGKVLAYAAVPDPTNKFLGAGDWVKGVLAVLGGKGGGKLNMAQGQGTDLAKVSEALRVAREFAELKL